jgi:hypothetical protein
MNRWASSTSLDTFLDNQNYTFKYGGSNTTSTSNTVGTSILQGFLKLSANETNDSTETWGIRASMVTNLQDAGSEAEIYNIECELITNNGWVPPIMASGDTIDNWVDTTYGYIMDQDPSQFLTALEWKFNQMSMAAGTGNRDVWQLSDLHGGSAFYGCVLGGTSIDVGVWILLLLLLAILIPMGIATVIMFISDSLKRKNSAGKGGLVDNTPSGIDSWQLALLKQTIKDESLQGKDLWQYSYGYHAGKGEYEMNYTAAFKVFNSSSLVHSL